MRISDEIEIQFQANSGTQYHLFVDYTYDECPATYDYDDESELLMEIVRIFPEPCGSDSTEIFNQWREDERLYEHAADIALSDYREVKYE